MLARIRHLLAGVQRTYIDTHANKPDVPRRLAFSNFEHLVSLSSEHRNTQTERQTVENTVWIAL